MYNFSYSHRLTRLLLSKGPCASSISALSARFLSSSARFLSSSSLLPASSACFLSSSSLLPASSVRFLCSSSLLPASSARRLSSSACLSNRAALSCASRRASSGLCCRSSSAFYWMICVSYYQRTRIYNDLLEIVPTLCRTPLVLHFRRRRRYVSALSTTACPES